MSLYTKPLKQLFQALQKAELIDWVRRDTRFPDLPHLPQYSSRLLFNPESTDGFYVGLNGSGYSSVSHEEALLKALSESAERLAQLTFRDSAVTLSSYPELFKRIANATSILNPELFHHSQYTKDTKLGWAPGFDLTTQQPAFIPAQLVYLNYSRHGIEPVLLDPNTTGSASGFSHEETLVRGLLELIERDAFMTVFLTKSQPTQIDIRQFRDKRVTKLAYLAKRYNLDVRLVNLTNDLGIPAIAAITIDHTGLGSGFTIGLKASFDTAAAVAGAVEESFMIRTYYRQVFHANNGKPPRIAKDQVSSMAARGLYWFPLTKLQELAFLFEHTAPTETLLSASWSAKATLDLLIMRLKENSFDVYYADVSLEALRSIGYMTYKVVVPQLQFLHLKEDHKVIQAARLERVAAYFGTDYHKPNQEPQPFL